MVASSFVPVLCLVGVAVLEEEDVVMLLPVDSGMISSWLMSDVVTACGVEHEDNPFVYSIGLSFHCMACLGGSRDF